MAAVTTFATTAQIQLRLDVGSVDATLIGQILDGVTAAMARYCNRLSARNVNLMLRQSDYVEDFNGDGGNVVQLSLYPIESVTSLIYGGPQRDFVNGTSFTEDEDYVVDADAGLLYRVGANWERWPKSLRITYTGGYVDPGSSPTGSQVALPNDVIEACILQTLHDYRNRQAIGMNTVSMGDGSFAYLEKGGLLERVRNRLEPYVRKAI